MNPIKLSKIEYYLGDELKERYPLFFKGVKTISKIIEKKNIPETEYIYAMLSSNGQWMSCDMSYRQKKLLLTKAWCDANIQTNVQDCLALKYRYEIDLLQKDMQLKELEHRLIIEKIERYNDHRLREKDREIQEWKALLQTKNLMIENLKAKCSNVTFE
jgi:hypothetical protein